MSDVSPELLTSIVHIGPRRARRLFDGLGAGWASTIDADPERVFATLRGMGRHRAREAADGWRQLRAVAGGTHRTTAVKR
jgi:hypothetical protein